MQVSAVLDAQTEEAQKLRAGLERLHKSYLDGARARVMTEGRGNTFGGLSSILEKYERDYLVARLGASFNEHTAYLLGPPLVVPETGRVTYAISTENLLLNAYRQTRFGLPPLLQVDTTHRLMVESQFCCMLIGTSSVTQHFHVIAYGVCSHEDIAAHEYVLRQVFRAVDAVVADRARKRQRV